MKSKKSVLLVLSATTLLTAMTATVIAAPNESNSNSPEIETITVGSPEPIVETVVVSEEESPVPESSTAPEESANPEESTAPETETPEITESPEVSTEPVVPDVLEVPDTQITEYTPDAIGTVSFGNLENRIRQSNYTVLSLQENINALNVMDYEEMEDDLRDQLNDISTALWQVSTIPNIQIPIVTENPDGSVSVYYNPMNSISPVDSYSVTSMENIYDSLRTTYDDLREGKLQEDNNSIILQLQDAQNVLIKAGESLYVAIIEIQNGLNAMYRGLEALDRTIVEMELRYELGHISALTLQEIKASRTSLYSNIVTMESTLDNTRTQLALFAGADLNSGVTLTALSDISETQLAAMNVDNDLATAKSRSYELFAAGRTLTDAEEKFEDADDQYDSDDYMFISAKHQYEGAKYTYNSSVQNFEASFRTLFNQVKDFRQVLGASYTTLAVEQSNYDVAELKHSQGQLSDNALLAAKDELSTAQDAVASAKIDLFTAYQNYDWAVNYGKLN